MTAKVIRTKLNCSSRAGGAARAGGNVLLRSRELCRARPSPSATCRRRALLTLSWASHRVKLRRSGRSDRDRTPLCATAGTTARYGFSHLGLSAEGLAPTRCRAGGEWAYGHRHLRGEITLATGEEVTSDEIRLVPLGPPRSAHLVLIVPAGQPGTAYTYFLSELGGDGNPPILELAFAIAIHSFRAASSARPSSL